MACKLHTVSGRMQDFVTKALINLKNPRNLPVSLPVPEGFSHLVTQSFLSKSENSFLPPPLLICVPDLLSQDLLPSYKYRLVGRSFFQWHYPNPMMPHVSQPPSTPFLHSSSSLLRLSQPLESNRVQH